MRIRMRDDERCAGILWPSLGRITGIPDCRTSFAQRAPLLSSYASDAILSRIVACPSPHIIEPCEGDLACCALARRPKIRRTFDTLRWATNEESVRSSDRPL